MKHILLFAFLFLSMAASAQQVATTIAGNNAYVYTPPGYSSAAKYPVLICVPGTGETGTDITKLNAYLPSKYIAAGTLTPGMIVICVQPPMQWATVAWLKQIYDSVLARWSINPAQVYGTGYSAGATAWDGFITTPAYSKLIAAVFSMSAPPMNSVAADAPLYKSYAQAGGHFWGLWGSADLATGYDVIAASMNAAAPGSAQATLINGMGHSSWDQFYNPSYQPNGLNLYQWLLKYGPPAAPPVSYKSALKSQLFTKNDCSCGLPTAVTYIVPAGKYTGTTSQAAVDLLAANDISANGQAYANANGICTPVVILTLQILSDGTIKTLPLQ